MNEGWGLTFMAKRCLFNLKSQACLGLGDAAIMYKVIRLEKGGISGD